MLAAALGLSPFGVGCASEDGASEDRSGQGEDDKHSAVGAAGDAGSAGSDGSGGAGAQGEAAGEMADSIAGGDEQAQEDSREDVSAASDDEDGAFEYAPCAAAGRVGWFAVVGRPADEFRSEGSTEVTGFVRDGVRLTDLQTVLAEEGDCKLISGPDLLCDPRCAAAEVCTTEGRCAAAPKSLDIGRVTVGGIEPPLSLSPNTANNYLPSAGTGVGYLPYELGQGLSLQGDGFSLRGWGVEELKLADIEPVLETDVPLLLRWQAPEHPVAGVRVYIELDIAHHGGVDAQVVCHAPDTGAFEVPAALVTGLLERGVAGFPAVTLSRRSVDSATIEGGCVEFVVASEMSRAVTIPGLTSCSSDDECPEEQFCQTSTMTCE